MLEFDTQVCFFPYGTLTHTGCSPIQDGNPYRTLTNMGYSPIWDAYPYGTFTHNESSPIWDIHQFRYSPIRTFTNTGGRSPIQDLHPYGRFPICNINPYGTFKHQGNHPNGGSHIWDLHPYMMFTHMWRTTIQDILQYGTFNMKLQVVHLLWLEPPEIRAT